MIFIRHKICILFLAAAALFAFPATARRSPSNIVIDAKTGEVLVAHNPNAVRHPASLTKLMTLYITFEAMEKGLIKMDDELPVSFTAANRSPSRLGLKAGSKIKVETAIDALIIKSANDCATVLAEGLGYSEAKFAEKMTEVAKALDMKDTVFKNASGLPNRRQVTTARDMATLAAAVYFHFPQYYDLFSRQKFTYDGKTYHTHNHLLKNFEGADGLKTGYIASAGFNIVTSAQRDGDRVIAVAMGHNSQKERDRTVARLMEQGFGKLALNRSSKAAATYVKLEHSDFLFNEHEQGKDKNSNENNAKQTAPDAVWMVQVGAFSNYAKARVYAQKVRRGYNELSSRNVQVEPAQNNAIIVYRAQLIHLRKSDAQTICKDLQKENKSCMVFPMEHNIQLTMAEK